MDSYVLKPETDTRADIAAAALLVTVMVLAVFFPENYMPDALIVAGRRLLPLTLMLPVFASGVIAYAWYRRADISPGFIDVALLAYTFYFLFRNLDGSAAGAAVKYALFGVGLFYLAAIIVQRDRPRQMLLTTMVGITSIITVYGLIEYAVGHNYLYGPFVIDAVVEEADALHRAGSSLAHPVAFGAFLVQVLPFTILAWMKGRGRSCRVMGAVSTLAGIAALFFTFSKGSWITAALLMLAGGIAILLGRGRRGLTAVIVIFLFAAMLTAVFWQQAASETAGRTEQSVDLRLGGWSGAYQGMINNPVTGVGLRQGRTEILKHCYNCRAFLYFEGREKPVDNNYVNMLLEQGFVGLFLWLMFIVLLLAGGLSVLDRDGSTRPWLLAGLASVAALLMNAMTFDALLIWSNSTFFWIAAGLLHGTELRARKLMNAA